MQSVVRSGALRTGAGALLHKGAERSDALARSTGKPFVSLRSSSFLRQGMCIAAKEQKLALQVLLLVPAHRQCRSL